MKMIHITRVSGHMAVKLLNSYNQTTPDYKGVIIDHRFYTLLLEFVRKLSELFPEFVSEDMIEEHDPEVAPGNNALKCFIAINLEIYTHI